MRDQLWWYIARSGGIIALVLSTLTVLWGLFYSTKVLNGKPSPKWLLDLHKYLGGATVLFTFIHVIPLMFDKYVSFGLTDIFVPFASAWKPGAVAWGIVTGYLLVAVQVTSMLMHKIPRKLWRWIHLSSYALFWTGIVHGITAGTDAKHPLYVAGTALGILSVLGLTIYRVLTQRGLRSAGSQAKPRPALSSSD